MRLENSFMNLNCYYRSNELGLKKNNNICSYNIDTFINKQVVHLKVAFQATSQKRLGIFSDLSDGDLFRYNEKI